MVEFMMEWDIKRSINEMLLEPPVKRGSTRQREYNWPDDCIFDMPADYLTGFPRGGIDNPVGVSYELEPCRREEDAMGHETMEITSLVWDGVEVFNLRKRFRPVKVIFNNPATIVYWEDGTKTVVTCMDYIMDGKPQKCASYSKETGLALCFMKKALGNKGNYNNAFREWIKED